MDTVAAGGVTEISIHRGDPNAAPHIAAEAQSRPLLALFTTARRKGL
jgi:hypothetical protein